MRVILCLACGDAFSPPTKRNELKSCGCSQAQVRRVNERECLYVGNKTVIVGFTMEQFENALREQPDKGTSKHFDSFICPKNTPSYVKVTPDVL
jgi:hypothetical protein